MALVAAAIEATAAEVPWRDLVRLAPGFAEEAARALFAADLRARGSGAGEITLSRLQKA